MNMAHTEIITLIHLVLISFFAGGQFTYLFVIHPASYQFFSINDQVFFLQNILKRYNPVLLFVLCLIVLSGGFMIAPLKGSLGVDYFARFGAKLVTKLAWFFAVFFVTAYQTLAIGFKSRYLDPARDLNGLDQKLAQIRRQMFVTSFLNSVLVIYIIFVSRGL